MMVGKKLIGKSRDKNALEEKCDRLSIDKFALGYEIIFDKNTREYKLWKWMD